MMKTQITIDDEEAETIIDALKRVSGPQPGSDANEERDEWMDSLIARFERARKRMAVS